MNSVRWVLAQPVSSEIAERNLLVSPVEICQTPEDVRVQVQKLKECEVDQKELAKRREQEAIKDQRIANLEEKLRLKDQELLLERKIGEIKDMEIESWKRSFVALESVADRAMKLAEISKPKAFGNWQLFGAAGVIGYIISELVHR
jgi:cell division FtsZ-interacting protein ZapD